LPISRVKKRWKFRSLIAARALTPALLTGQRIARTRVVFSIYKRRSELAGATRKSRLHALRVEGSEPGACFRG
jgi:hypothetical protein